MMAETTVVIEQYKVNPHTGHITVSVHCHTVDGNSRWNGPTKVYGTDLQMFRDKFQGSVEAFETWVANEHKSITGPPTGLVETLQTRKGKVIG
jgi:hypothetical protein